MQRYCNNCYILYTAYAFCQELQYTFTMDDLHSILSRKDFDEPPEVRAIKDFVQRHYRAEVGVSVQTHMVIVTTKSAALAGTLRMNLPKLQEAAATDKRIMLRIG